jgi:hypothetical protein
MFQFGTVDYQLIFSGADTKSEYLANPRKHVWKAPFCIGVRRIQVKRTPDC